MSTPARQVYIISDIHLGGDYPASTDPEDRGFRICTHVAELASFVDALADKPTPVELVINGDLIDFLAEQDAETGGNVAFVATAQLAAQRLDRILDRDAVLVRALARLLAQGHRLTLLLGNHDVELSLPLVRQRLAYHLGITGRQDFNFLFDGEAYTIGSVLIEHGNRYDKFNVIDHDGLRRVRSLMSRGQDVPAEFAFAPPAGSHMVVDVINPIKQQYRFVDLLKPETDVVVPILLALEPGFRSVLTRVAELSLAARKHGVTQAALPSFGGDINAHESSEMSSFGGDISFAPARPDPLAALLASVSPHASVILNAGAPDANSDIGQDISAMGTINRMTGIAKLLLSRNTPELDRRLPALLAALRALQNDNTFARNVEYNREYARAALDLSIGGYDYVVFGHTHMARDVWMTGGSRYFNAGTWADLIKFPTEIVSGPEPQALDAVRAFVEDLRDGRLSAWTSFQPTYVRFDLDPSDGVISAALCDYTTGGAL